METNIPTEVRNRDIASVIARLRFGDSDGDDHDIAARELEQLRRDLAIQAVNAKTVTDLQAEIEGMRSLIRRVIDWEPAFPVESSLLDELAAAVKHPDVSPTQQENSNG